MHAGSSAGGASSSAGIPDGSHASDDILSLTLDNGITTDLLQSRRWSLCVPIRGMGDA